MNERAAGEARLRGATGDEVRDTVDRAAALVVVVVGREHELHADDGRRSARTAGGSRDANPGSPRSTAGDAARRRASAPYCVCQRALQEFELRGRDRRVGVETDEQELAERGRPPPRRLTRARGAARHRDRRARRGCRARRGGECSPRARRRTGGTRSGRAAADHRGDTHGRRGAATRRTGDPHRAAPPRHPSRRGWRRHDRCRRRPRCGSGAPDRRAGRARVSAARPSSA